jgi:hypothetical protein
MASDIVYLRQFAVMTEEDSGLRSSLPETNPALTTVDRRRAFSSEVDTGSRVENASKQESRASVLIQSEPKVI